MSLETNDDGMKIYGEDVHEAVDEFGDLLFLEGVWITDNYGNSVQIWRQVGERYEE